VPEKKKEEPKEKIEPVPEKKKEEPKEKIEPVPEKKKEEPKEKIEPVPEKKKEETKEKIEQIPEKTVVVPPTDEKKVAVSQEQNNSASKKPQENEIDKSIGKNWSVVENSSEKDSDKTSNKPVDVSTDSVNLVDSSSLENSAVKVNKLPTGQERLKEADEKIQKAHNSKSQNQNAEALSLFLSALDTINPDYFKDEKDHLPKVNQKIIDCSLEVAGCHVSQNNFTQSTKYAQTVLKSDPHNLRAIYYLGVSYSGTGKNPEALEVLKQSKNLKNAKDVEYLEKIQREIEKLEAKDSQDKEVAKSQNELKTISEPKRNEETKRDDKEEKKQSDDMSAPGYFIGSVVSTSIISLLATKYLFKMPLKQGLMTSLGIGVVIGGVSLFVNSLSGDKNKNHK